MPCLLYAMPNRHFTVKIHLRKILDLCYIVPVQKKRNNYYKFLLQERINPDG